MRFKEYLEEARGMPEGFETDHEKIKEWLNKFYLNIDEFTIDEDGTVNTTGSVHITNQRIKKLPIKFGRVEGSFNLNRTTVRTLAGCPKYVGKDFVATHGKLTTNLVGGPEYVGGDYEIDYNAIESLIGAPKKVGGSFKATDNSIDSLEGGPEEVGGDFDVSTNHLDSLEYAPRIIGRSFSASHNNITSLVGISDHIDSIGSDQQGRHGSLFMYSNPYLEEGGLGLVAIKGLGSVRLALHYSDNKDEKLELLFTKYLQAKENDIFGFQQELIENGFEKYAVL